MTALHATAATWVQVRGADGHVVWDHVMHAGDVWIAPAGATGLTLTTGNAGGLSITQDGVAGGPVGPAGAVLHGISLAGTTAPSPAAAPVTPRRTSPPRHRPAPSPPDTTADDLNARQLTRTH